MTKAFNPGDRPATVEDCHAMLSLVEAHASHLASRLAAVDWLLHPSFQERVQPWMMECFGAEISADRVERGDRFLEEAFELLQSGGYDPARVTKLRDYVWSRPIGEPPQEVGGVMVTLAAYCLAHNVDMHHAAEVELARISAPDVVVKIRAKQASKPTGSALPIATSSDAEAEVAADATCPGCGLGRACFTGLCPRGDACPWDGER